MLMGNAMMLRLIPVYESFFVGTKIDGGETRVSYPMSPANLAGAPSAFRGLHSVRVAYSGELFYVACKLGRRPWRLSGLARRASSKTRVGLFPHVWSSSSPSSSTFSH